jgi:hypothetical protein
MVALGAVAAFLWPSATAVVAFSTSVFLCAAWFAMERTIQSRTHR